LCIDYYIKSENTIKNNEKMLISIKKYSIFIVEPKMSKEVYYGTYSFTTNNKEKRKKN
jgi:hypothetical protein